MQPPMALINKDFQGERQKKFAPFTKNTAAKLLVCMNCLHLFQKLRPSLFLPGF